MATLRVVHIIDWLNQRGAALEQQGVEFGVERSSAQAHVEFAFADYFATGTGGGITGWASGAFDFEVICEDQRTVYFRHQDVTDLAELSEAFSQFEAALFQRSTASAD